MPILWIVLGLLAAAVLALVLTASYIRLVDRAPSNDRTALTYDYELPHYYARDSRGVKTDVRWPGWDARAGNGAGHRCGRPTGARCRRALRKRDAGRRG